MAGIHHKVQEQEPITGKGGIFFQLTLKLCSITSLWSVAPLGVSLSSSSTS